MRSVRHTSLHGGHKAHCRMPTKDRPLCTHAGDPTSLAPEGPCVCVYCKFCFSFFVCRCVWACFSRHLDFCLACQATLRATGLREDVTDSGRDFAQAISHLQSQWCLKAPAPFVGKSHANALAICLPSSTWQSTKLVEKSTTG